MRYRYRDTWTEQGDKIPVSKNSPANRSQPFCNLPKAHYHAYEIQALRTLGTMARRTGDAGGALDAAREITAWNDELAEFDIDDELAEPGLRALHVLADAVYATVGAC